MENISQIERPEPAIKLNVAIPYIILTFSSIMINFTVLAVSIKALKRSLHNSLVLLMCLSDGFNGVVVFWFAILGLLPSIQNSKTCIFTLFAGSLTSLINPCIVFMISTERYLVVRRYNFGIKQNLNRYKYLIVTTVMLFPFLVSLSVFLIPHNTQNQACFFSQDFFGEYYATYVYVIYGTVTVLDFTIILISLTTSVLIWTMFFKRNVVGPYMSPKKESVLKPNICTMETSSNTFENQNEELSDVASYRIPDENNKWVTNVVTIEHTGFTCTEETRIKVQRNTDSSRPVQTRVSVLSVMLEPDPDKTDLPERQTTNSTRPGKTSVSVSSVMREPDKTDLPEEQTTDSSRPVQTRVSVSSVMLEPDPDKTDLPERQTTDSSRPVQTSVSVSSVMLETDKTCLPSEVYILSKTDVQDLIDTSNDVPGSTRQISSSAHTCTSIRYVNVKNVNDLNKTEKAKSKHETTAPSSYQQNVRRSSIIPKDQHKIAWEVRAFTLSVMIAGSTILLTGPFVASFWLQAYKIQISTSVKFLLNMLCLLNYTLDPILYVLGFPKIKDKLKHLYPCRQTGLPN